jgi:hypothetical protein
MSINRNITSASAVSILTVDSLFPAGIELQQYATDQAIGSDSLQVAETRMGVDGKMVAGYVPGIIIVNISLEASSPSTEMLNQLYDAMVVGKTIYMCKLVSTVESINTVFTWFDGVLHTATPVPAQKKVLDPTAWTFHFERMERSSSK